MLSRDEGVDVRVLRSARPPGVAGDLDDAYLTNTIVDIHRMSRGLVWLGAGARRTARRRGCPLRPQTVERLMRQAGIAGIYRRRRRGCTRRDAHAHHSEIADNVSAVTPLFRQSLGGSQPLVVQSVGSTASSIATHLNDSVVRGHGTAAERPSQTVRPLGMALPLENAVAIGATRPLPLPAGRTTADTRPEAVGSLVGLRNRGFIPAGS